MKKATKDNLFLTFILFATISGISGAVGIALSFVEGIKTVIASIPFWIMCGIFYLFAYLITKFIKVPEVKQ